MAETSCDFEFMEYINESSVDPNLICGICHKPFKDPVCTKCDHTYGRECITHWLTNNVENFCPVCLSQPLLVNDLTQASRPLRCMLDQLRVRCTLCNRTDLQRGNFLEHLNKACPYATVACQAVDVKCPWKGRRDELDNHVSTCVFETLRPILASMIAENQQLMKQVQKHDDEIKELKSKMSQGATAAAGDSDNESDTVSVSGFSVDGSTQKEEDAIFIRNLPATIKFNDLFDYFSKVGRIKYDVRRQKVGVFIFKNPTNKDGRCAAKVIYVDKESAAAAVAEYNQRHVPQWNTHLQVSISNPKKSTIRDSEKANKGESTGMHHEAKPKAESEKASNQSSNATNNAPRSESSDERNKEFMNKNRRRPPHHPKHADKSTN
ncbi:unnamed protein product [Adineta steineri]|uniref:Uncharacterized protein n=1 Tax=Adineta steineri TaxID=433720 RepID=A0A819IR05_9BILA|nr:unnamed protein product [Adineta steineri]CAF3821751.1 unnamed protein product [Adineta steineri]CAF3920303.1 unnamed protein product [Adineta steineri]